VQWQNYNGRLKDRLSVNDFALALLCNFDPVAIELVGYINGCLASMPNGQADEAVGPPSSGQAAEAASDGQDLPIS